MAIKRFNGTVKWFNAHKGYGFITPDEGGDDIFVHATSIESSAEPRVLSEGEVVTYELVEGRKGLMASKVRSKAA